jgi:hypothetical protein
MAWDDFKKFAEKHGGIPIDPDETEEEGDTDVWLVTRGEDGTEKARKSGDEAADEK